MWKYPKTKFVDEVDHVEQEKHFQGELKEAREAKTLSELVEELADAEHSFESFLRVVLRELKENGHEFDFNECRQKVIEKNRARGYDVDEAGEADVDSNDPREAHGEAESKGN